MTSYDLGRIALALVANGKGILAADETVPTLTKRFDTLRIQSTAQGRCAYREMLFTSPGAAEFISGVIMYDETIRQKNTGGTPLAEVLRAQSIFPGIKVDTGAKPLAGSPDETVTEGLDGLRDRLSEYRAMGACFAKWRAVIRPTDTLPSAACVSANAHALARYAALCQEQGPCRSLSRKCSWMGRTRSNAVTTSLALFFPRCSRLSASRGSRSKGSFSNPTWSLPAKPVVARPPSRRLRPRRYAVCADMCLSQYPGSCSCQAAKVHGSRPLISTQLMMPGPKPWRVSFSYGRALQDPALEAWHGQEDNLLAGQQALYRRASLNAAASMGKYVDEMETA